jgi:pimeloyl-ACP methyl ester carboxylesterase
LIASWSVKSRQQKAQRRNIGNDRDAGGLMLAILAIFIARRQPRFAPKFPDPRHDPRHDPSQDLSMSDGYTSHFISAQDGLRLHVRSYGPRIASGLPVVCLPGLARSSADFHALATTLAGDAARPRYVAAMDYRGRGRSEYDRDPGNYNFTVELSDILAVLTALELGPAVFVGTSRGGILAMLLASARPTAIAGVVLNDIGPVIDTRGLARIKGYVGKLPVPTSYADGAEVLRRLFGAQFPKLTASDWLDFARRTFTERDGKFVADYDPRLSTTLEGIDLERPLPSLWKEFDALARLPVLVIRGANSDVLAAASVVAMRERRDDIETIELPDQGHAPLLVEADIIGRIGSFIIACEQGRR